MPNRARSGDGQQTGPRGGADERELLQRHFHRPRARPLADHDVELVVLEGRIQDLFDHRRHPMDLVDEQHFVLSEVGQDGARSPGFSRTGPDVARTGDAELVADHVRQRGLAEAGRAVEQHVIERFGPLPRRGDRHLQVLADRSCPM